MATIHDRPLEPVQVVVEDSQLWELFHQDPPHVLTYCSAPGNRALQPVAVLKSQLPVALEGETEGPGLIDQSVSRQEQRKTFTYVTCIYYKSSHASCAFPDLVLPAVSTYREL